MKRLFNSIVSIIKIMIFFMTTVPVLILFIPIYLAFIIIMGVFSIIFMILIWFGGFIDDIVNRFKYKKWSKEYKDFVKKYKEAKNEINKR